jgi:hypothetical protein
VSWQSARFSFSFVPGAESIQVFTLGFKTVDERLGVGISQRDAQYDFFIIGDIKGFCDLFSVNDHIFSGL